MRALRRTPAKPHALPKLPRPSFIDGTDGREQVTSGSGTKRYGSAVSACLLLRRSGRSAEVAVSAFGPLADTLALSGRNLKDWREDGHLRRTRCYVPNMELARTSSPPSSVSSISGMFDQVQVKRCVNEFGLNVSVLMLVRKSWFEVSHFPEGHKVFELEICIYLISSEVLSHAGPQSQRLPD
jgi:hypothetical protein